uniref:Transglycosylase n=1 Tax=viral metagenome TaxID=1070528 RepID=A0A6M3IL13_9ZZZZ
MRCALIILCLFGILVCCAAEAKAVRPALKQARKHATAHAVCLGKPLPKSLRKTQSVRRLRRYINRTWRKMRYPNWRRYNSFAWIPLARHAGWPESTVPMLRKVIRRESDGNPRLIDPGSPYIGLMQIGHYHTSVNLLNPYTNLRYGLLMWKKNGWVPWRSTAW